MADICPICEGSGLRLVERPGGRLAECTCEAGRMHVQDCEERREAQLGGTIAEGRKQRLVKQWGSIERIPTPMLTQQQRFDWMTDVNGPYETWPAEMKAAHAEHEPKTIPPNPEAIARLKAKLPSAPKRERTWQKKPNVPFTNGMAGMNGKICGLEAPVSEADLMAWWESEGKER